MSHIFSHIVAASENNVIGIDGELPWKLPDDFRFFKNKTWAMPIIMGRKTYEAMEGSLPGRINIVVTHKKDWSPLETTVVHDIPSAIEKAKEADTREIFIIGGGTIFEETMNIVDRIYLTRVHVTLEGDTKYPEIDESVFEKVSEQFHPEDEKHKYSFTFTVWQRKKS